MKMDNKTYDTLKYIAQIVLPALATLYAGVAKIWGIPYGVEVPGTIMLVDAFLGALLMISSNNYYKSGKDTDGTLWLDGTELSGLDINLDEAELAEKDTVKLYIGKHSA